jgi:hypothetical protein
MFSFPFFFTYSFCSHHAGREFSPFWNDFRVVLYRQ